MRGLRFIGSLLVAAALAGLLSWAPAGGGEKEKAVEAKAALPDDLEHVPAAAAGLVSLRPADVWSSSVGVGIRKAFGKDLKMMTRDFEGALGLSVADIERLTVALLLGSPDPSLLIVRTRKPYDRKKVVRAFAPGATEEMYKGHTIHVGGRNKALVMLNDNVFIGGLVGEVKTALDKPGARSEALTTALTAAAGRRYAAVFAANPPAIAKELQGRDLGPDAEQFKPLLKATVALATVELGKTTRGHLRVRFPGEAEAQAGEKSLKAALEIVVGQLGRMIKGLGKDEDVKELAALLRKVEADLKASPLKRDKEEITATLTIKIDQAQLGAIAVVAVQRVRMAAARIQSMNNLKQLALAMHNYMDSTGAFPAAALYDKDGKAILSWRVQLLPYLDQNELYKEFKLDEAWDSPHNKKLLAKMPRLFASPISKAKPGETHYQAFVGPSAGFEGKRGIHIRDISDGTSNTIMFAEASKAVPWTKPEDLPYDPKKPLPKIGGLWKDGFIAAFFDGSVRFLPSKMKETTLRAYITRNGGEVIAREDE
jgi:hypothetical protein